MSTAVDKEKDEKHLEVNSGCCGVENKDAAALGAKVEQAQKDEAAKEQKTGGCGCS